MPQLHHRSTSRFSSASSLPTPQAHPGGVDIDEADTDGQTLLLWYPEVEPRDGAYVRPAVRIESGAKSALDPSRPVDIRPYISEEVTALDLTIKQRDRYRDCADLLGQSGNRTRPASLARTAQRSPTRGAACVATLLRLALPSRLRGRWTGAQCPANHRGICDLW
jgi:hypothetical protein